MSTGPETAQYILQTLRNAPRFSVRRMFGEYALYADGTVVGLICDDTLYVKICPASERLSTVCETDAPYPGAKPYYVISEEQLNGLTFLPAMLFDVAESLPQKRKRKKV